MLSSVYPAETVCVSVSPFWVVVSSREELVGCGLASRVSLWLDRPSARPGERGPASVTQRGQTSRSPPAHPCGALSTGGTRIGTACRSAVVPCVTGACQHCRYSWGPETEPPCFQKIHRVTVTPTGRGIQTGVCGCGIPECERDVPRIKQCCNLQIGFHRLDGLQGFCLVAQLWLVRGGGWPLSPGP